MGDWTSPGSKSLVFHKYHKRMSYKTLFEIPVYIWNNRNLIQISRISDLYFKAILLLHMFDIEAQTQFCHAFQYQFSYIHN